MGGRVLGVLIIFFFLVKCENVARLNVVFPQLDNDGSKKPLPVPLVEPGSLPKEQSTLNLMNLQSEILRLQKILKEEQEAEVTTKEPPSRATTQSTTSTTFSEKFPSFDFKSLQSEIDALQKQLMERQNSNTKARASEDNDQEAKSSKSLFYFGDPVKSKSFDSVNNHTKSRASDFDSFSEDDGRFTINDNNNSSNMRYTYPIDYQPYGTSDLEEDKKEQHKEHHKENEKSAREEEFNLLGKHKLGGVFEMLSEFIKLLSNGDGKGILSYVLKLPALILKGILQSVMAVFLKQGLKGLLTRLLVPAIILIAINGLLLVMVWWLWDDVSCSQSENYMKYNFPPGMHTMAYYSKQPHYNK